MTILQLILFAGFVLTLYIGYQMGHQDGLKEGLSIGQRRGMAIQAAKNANR
jgi:hypothetical protein